MVTLFLESILKKLKTYRPYTDFMGRCAKDEFPVSLYGPKGSFLSLIIAALQRQRKRTILVVLPSEKEVEAVVSDCSAFGIDAVGFPWWQAAPYSEQPNHTNVSAKRMSVLAKLMNGEHLIVCASVRALMGVLPPRDLLENNLIRLEVRGSFDPQSIEARLESWGYLRVPRVSSPGEFALRGEVLDVGIPGESEAVRVVFDFDEIEEIKGFDPVSQSSLDKRKTVTLFPASEFIWTDTGIERVVGFLDQQRYPGSGDGEVAERLVETRSTRFEEIYYPLAFDTPSALVDYLDSTALTIFVSDKRLINAAEGV